MKNLHKNLSPAYQDFIMNTFQIAENLYKNVYKIQEELRAIPGSQLIIDHTGAYLTVGDSVTRIERPPNNDTLLPYTMDAITAVEEEHDLTESVPDQDIEGLALIAASPINGNGQRMNAYRRL